MTTDQLAAIPEHDQDTHRLAMALAPALADVDGNPWEYAPPTEEQDWTATAYIECGNQRLAIRVGGHQMAGRVAIHGDYPRDPETRADIAHSYRIPRDVPDDPKMTATTAKSPEQIANEIARKVLPDYRHRLAAVTHVLAENERYAERRNELATQVIRVGGTFVEFVRLTIDTSTPGTHRPERNRPMQTLPALGARVRVDNGAAPADQPTGTVVGHGTSRYPDATDYPTHHEPAAFVLLDANHAGWIEPNGRPGMRGTYVSTIIAHPDNLEPIR